MSPSTSSPRRRADPSPRWNVFLYLVAFRLVNALTVRTFFQPDEFFQSLEPAWQIAFGKEQGAWITWEWRNQLRSSLHPLFFAAIYKIIDSFATLLTLSPALRAELLIAGPKAAQAVLSATGDFYTWRLASRIYGEDSRGSLATLMATVLNPWQWFCSTRTLSNCLETSLTIAALDFWPWQWSAGAAAGDTHAKNNEKAPAATRAILPGLRKSLSLAAVACILRPTNIIIWVTLAGFALLRGQWEQRKILIREVLICGPAVLAVSAVADRLFYGLWTFPPLRFLYFNIAQSLAVFYGRNNWHYYATEGFPLLLTTLIPFAIPGLYLTLTTRVSSASDRVQTATRVQLATVCLIMPLVLSLISHKEVRFIYPLLPSLHILAAPRLVQTFWPALTSSLHTYTPKRLILSFLIFANVVIAIYLTVYHASGPLNVLTYLRRQNEVHGSTNTNARYPIADISSTSDTGITAGFLMPCHSTPWRSHLVYPSIDAWALSCEPPIDLNETQKAVYRDEADQFYDDPEEFLRHNMAGGLRHLPRRPSYLSGFQHEALATTSKELHEWPDYLIFFEQLEPTMRKLIQGSSYAECWRTWNTAWHDDWRRRGDIVAWCLDPAEQDAWRSKTQRHAQELRDRQFQRIVSTIRKQATIEQSRGWKSMVSRLRSWPASVEFSLEALKRSTQSVFSSRSSRWPWGKRSRLDMLLAKFRWGSPSWTDSIPSWPEWLGGRRLKRVSKRERELWS